MKKSVKLTGCFFVIMILIFVSIIPSFAESGNFVGIGEAKWNMAFFTEGHIYLRDSVPYLYIKDAVNLEYHSYVADETGDEISTDDKISTGDKLIQIDTNEELFTFVILGDTNRDGLVTSADAREILRMSAKLVLPNDFLDYAAADVNNSYTIDAGDARNVLRYAAKITDYEDFSGDKLQYYVYMDQAYVNVAVSGDIKSMDDIFTPEKYDGDLVERVYVLANEDEYAMLVLKLKNPGRDNVDRLLYKMNENDKLDVSAPVDHIFRR